MSRQLSILVAGLLAAGLSLSAFAVKNLDAIKAEQAKPAGARSEQPRVFTEQEKRDMRRQAESQAKDGSQKTKQ